MRRHVVSSIYNYFIYMYINLFLANGLARKTTNSCTELLVIIIKKKGCLRKYVGTGKTNLKILAKEFKSKKT